MSLLHFLAVADDRQGPGTVAGEGLHGPDLGGIAEVSGTTSWHTHAPTHWLLQTFAPYTR